MSQTITSKTGETFTFPDELTPDQIKAAMDKHYGKTAPRPKVPISASIPINPAMIPLRSEWLPTAGGFAGGLAAGPIGAGVGGALGEAVRQTQTFEPPSLSGMAMQGGLQAGAELTGLGLAKLARGLAKPFARKAVSFTPAPKASTILDPWGRPFMVEQPTVSFTRRPSPENREAGRAIMHVAESVLPGGPFLRPLARMARSPAANRLADWLKSPAVQKIARQSPRAFLAALNQLTYAAEPDATAQ